MKHARIFLTVISLIIFFSLSMYSQPLMVKVWPEGAPGSIQSTLVHEDIVYTETGAPRVRHVTDPQLFVYLPKGGKTTSSPHTAVIICPGGGYIRLALDHEGFDAAKWFTQNGVAGIVLKYRLPSDTIMQNKTIGPLQDVQEAIRIVRRNAKKWNIDPHKIGVMGFSAGGHLAASASTLYGYKTYDAADTVSARPDFSIIVYGTISMQEKIAHNGSRRALLGEHPDSALVNFFSGEKNVDASTPPAFIVHASNDTSVPVANSVLYFNALNAHSIPAELHIYETGGHGFGLAADRKTSESTWPAACRKWMHVHGFSQ